MINNKEKNTKEKNGTINLRMTKSQITSFLQLLMHCLH